MPRIGNEELRAELRHKAYQMRLKRMSYVDIGVELGYSAPTIRTLTREYIDALTIPEAEKARAMELDKLEDYEAIARKLLEDQHITVSHGKVVLLNGHTLKDTDPIFKALDRLLRISERKSRLLGLDMPTKSEHTVTTSTPIDAAVQDLVRQVETQNNERKAELEATA